VGIGAGQRKGTICECTKVKSSVQARNGQRNWGVRSRKVSAPNLILQAGGTQSEKKTDLNREARFEKAQKKNKSETSHGADRMGENFSEKRGKRLELRKRVTAGEKGRAQGQRSRGAEDKNPKVSCKKFLVNKTVIRGGERVNGKSFFQDWKYGETEKTQSNQEPPVAAQKFGKIVGETVRDEGKKRKVAGTKRKGGGRGAV